MKIDIRSDGSTKVIALAGHLGGVLSQSDRRRIQAMIQPGAQLALDFTNVQEISGVGLRRLLLLTSTSAELRRRHCRQRSVKHFARDRSSIRL